MRKNTIMIHLANANVPMNREDVSLTGCRLTLKSTNTNKYHKTSMTDMTAQL